MKIEEIENYFLKAKEKNKIQNSYIIYGGNKEKREEVAIFLSGILNCDNNKYCKKCESCIKILNKTHPDVKWVIPQKSLLSIEEIRELKMEIFLKPFYGKYKIYIFEIENIREDAASAFLKILEEPPLYGIIILLCPNVNLLLPTILSRCTKIYLNYTLPELIEIYRKNISEFVNLLEILNNNNFFEFFRKIDEICKKYEREEIENLIEHILIFMRDSFLMEKNIPSHLIIDKEIKKKDILRFLDLELIEKIWEIKQRIRYNINIRIAIENLLFQSYLYNLKYKSRSGGMADAPGSGPGEG